MSSYLQVFKSNSITCYFIPPITRFYLCLSTKCLLIRNIAMLQVRCCRCDIVGVMLWVQCCKCDVVGAMLQVRCCRCDSRQHLLKFYQTLKFERVLLLLYRKRRWRTERECPQAFFSLLSLRQSCFLELDVHKNENEKFLSSRTQQRSVLQSLLKTIQALGYFIKIYLKFLLIEKLV